MSAFWLKLVECLLAACASEAPKQVRASLSSLHGSGARLTSVPSELPMAMTPEMVVEQFARMNGAIAEITATLKIIQDGAGAAAKGGWNDEGAANGKTGKNRGIEGKIFENIGVFKGGESEWNGWADDFKIRVDTRCEEAGATLEYLRNLG